MKKRIKTNLLIFLIAIPVAILLFLVVQNPEFLSGSVISLQEQQAMKDNNRDLWYKNDKNVLDVFLDERVNDLDYLTLSIIYDPDSVSFDLENFDSQTEYKILSNEEWNLLIQFSNFAGNSFDHKNSLFMLNFDGKEPNILVSEATAYLFSGTNKLLSIGSLNPYRETHD